MWPACIGVILDSVSEGSPDELLSIVKQDLLIQRACVVLPGNPICMSYLLVDVSMSEITESCDTTNSYSVSMGPCA